VAVTDAMYLSFWFFGDTNFTSTALGTSWNTTTTGQATGQVNVGASTGNYIQWTGMQLEKGSLATSFEWRSYIAELARAQRYYWRVESNTSDYTIIGAGHCQSATSAMITASCPVPMFRGSTPYIAFSAYGDVTIVSPAASPVLTAVGSTFYAALSGHVINFSGTTSGLTAGQGCYARLPNSAGKWFAMAAEL
jgi:hypothetical protein